MRELKIERDARNKEEKLCWRTREGNGRKRNRRKKVVKNNRVEQKCEK